MLLQLALWQQQQQQQDQGLLQRPGASGAVLGVVGGVAAAAAAKALPYAVALAAALSVESPFMHIDALNAETEAAAADTELAAGQAEGLDDALQQQQQQQQQQQTAEAKAANRKKMSSAAAAHARFRSPHGDAISALNALSAYEAAAADGNMEAFCAANYLHARHLREMVQLRQQLGRTLLQLQQGLSQGLAQTSPALSGGGSAAAEAQQLMQQLLAGLQGDAGQQLMQPLPPVPTGVLDVLQRALAAGWCDQVQFSRQTCNFTMLCMFTLLRHNRCPGSPAQRSAVLVA
jgi:ATP-dependent RNA helicase DHX37/DHR1